jgi:hypothetical protein
MHAKPALKKTKQSRYYIPLISLLLITSLTALSGCSGLFFFPDKTHYFTPKQANINFDDVYLNTEDGETIHGWHLKPNQPSKGIVYFLHGNAENISTHTGSVVWLIDEGYEIFALDYRGFGKSSGSPDLQGALIDIKKGYEWVISNRRDNQQNIFILGQSLGAALTLSFASHSEGLDKHVNGIIIDAGFPSFRGIAKEKLGDVWLTWPLQYPLSWLIPSQYDSDSLIHNIAPIPLLVIHSTQDIVIPFHHGQAIYQQAYRPKEFLVTDTPHTATFTSAGYMDYTLKFIEYYSKQP